MGELESLQAVAAFGLLADHIEHRIDQLGALSVVALRPVVARTALTEHEVVRAEQLSEWAGAHRVHCAGLEVDKDRAGHILAAGGLVEIHVDALELQVRVAVISASRVDAVFVGDDLPELTKQCKQR